MIQKKAQAFMLDYVVSILLFTVVIVAGVLLIRDIIPNTDYQELFNEHEYLSTQLLHQGYPLGWNASNVLIPGIIQGQRINQSLLDEYALLSYDYSKQLFGLSGDYYFFLRNSSQVVTDISGSCGFGFSLPTDVNCIPLLTNMSYDNFITSSRIVIYQNKTRELVLYTWR